MEFTRLFISAHLLHTMFLVAMPLYCIELLLSLQASTICLLNCVQSHDLARKMSLKPFNHSTIALSIVPSPA